MCTYIEKDDNNKHQVKGETCRELQKILIIEAKEMNNIEVNPTFIVI